MPEPLILPGDHDTMTDAQKRGHYAMKCKHPACLDAGRAYHREYSRAHLRSKQSPTPVVKPVQKTVGLGSVRRLQALVHAGWSPTRLARQMRMTESTVWFFLLQPPEMIRTSTRDTIDRVWRHLRYEKPPENLGTARIEAEVSRRIAAAHHWRGVYEWNNIDTDPTPRRAH